MNLVINIDQVIDQKFIQEYTNFLENYFEQELEYSIVIVDNEYIQKLNLEFRQKDFPTDVLTFVENQNNYLGDIIISYDKIVSQANEYNHAFKREFLFLITHGYLHLLGYDHITKEQELKMFNLQEKLLNSYGVKR